MKVKLLKKIRKKYAYRVTKSVICGYGEVTIVNRKTKQLETYLEECLSYPFISEFIGQYSAYSYWAKLLKRKSRAKGLAFLKTL